MHEVLGGAGEKKNGPNRSATLAVHVSQRQAGRSQMEAGRECSTPQVLPTHTSGWGPPLVFGRNLIGFSPWKCLFLSPLRRGTSRPLISSLFIKGFPEESAPGLWLEGPPSQGDEAEGRICSGRNIIFLTCGPDSWRWCENLPRTPQGCVIATQKVPFNFLLFFFPAQFGSCPPLGL